MYVYRPVNIFWFYAFIYITLYSNSQNKPVKGDHWPIYLSENKDRISITFLIISVH